MNTCVHTPDLGTLSIYKLIGNSRTTESQLAKCRFKCRDCGEYLQYLPPANGILRTIHLISLPIGLLLAIPFFLLVIKTVYSEALNEKVMFCLIFLGGTVLAFGAAFLSKLIAALLIKHGKLGRFRAVSEDELCTLEFYGSLIRSDERSASKRVERRIVCIIMIPIVIAIALMLIFIK